MNKLAINNLFVTSCSSFRRSADLAEISHGRFYQSLGLLLAQDVYSRHGRQNLGELLVELAEHVHALRQMDELEQVSEILVSSPLPRRYRAIGRYYQAVSIQNFGEGDACRAQSLLEDVVRCAPPAYRVRAMISLAASLRHQRDNRSALCLYREAAHFASRVRIQDIYATLSTQKMFAVIGSENGDHRGAVALLEQLYPVAQSVRSSYPHVYYDYLNSLAVELNEVGRLEEASNVSRIVVASPFAPAYPEWRETREEIELRGRRASRSTVSLGESTAKVDSGATGNVPADYNTTVLREPGSQPGTLLFMPSRAPDEDHRATLAQAIRENQGQPARVLDLELHKKKKMAKQPNDALKGKHTPMEINDMSTSDLLCAIMNRISGDISDEALGKVLSLLDEIALDHQQKS